MIEDRTDELKTKILYDPWLDGEKYLGSWAIYHHMNLFQKIFQILILIYGIIELEVFTNEICFFCLNHFYVA